MRDFAVNGSEYTHSIGFDPTKRSELVVTVGVYLNRTQEAFLLDMLYRELHDEDYLPFRTKSRDLSIPNGKLVNVLMECRGRVGVCFHQDSVKLPYAEAVHSAILADELSVPTNKSIAIVDGDQSKAMLFQHAASGVGVVPPPIVHCTRSELYYPHLLLADLIAGMVADEIEQSASNPTHIPPNGPVTVVENTTNRGERWSRGYNAAVRNKGDVRSHTFEQGFASSFHERVSCWFHGWFGHPHAPPPMSDGVRPVAGRLDAMVCKEIAQWILEQQ